MVAGGGASVVYADTFTDLGAGHLLANYGEYSGTRAHINAQMHAFMHTCTLDFTHTPAYTGRRHTPSSMCTPKLLHMHTLQ